MQKLVGGVLLGDLFEQRVGNMLGAFYAQGQCGDVLPEGLFGLAFLEVIFRSLEGYFADHVGELFE